ncbi:META domain-containing protein [Defluviimonas sp. SAOS-178_SWC]|uniref:META domain-containing protein n=1 Tax=Defluviimonas sp. SAOS-178_SWC TaxID=3121287 RepID=UPI0032218D55
MRRIAPLAAALSTTVALSACAGDETLRGFVPEGSVWRLTEIDGTAFAARATIRFPAPGKIAGDAPCNRYSGNQTAPYPWFRAERILSTKRACADLSAEQLFFTALGRVTLAEVQGDVLILSSPDGPVMVFTIQP